MKQALADTEILFPAEPAWDRFVQLPAEEPFAEHAISFLNALSALLMKEQAASAFPEIITFAFFCRKANLLQLKKEYYPKEQTRKGRGIVFHITPSNVPLNFAYSLVSGILSGNLNIVRLPSKKFEQVELICKAIHSLHQHPDFQSFSERMILLRYDKTSAASRYFSSIAQARILWGGNETIRSIRKNIPAPEAADLAFGDKYSVCVIHADEFIRESSPEHIIRGFYNDTFLFDQNACTSPHLIVWLGKAETIASAKNIFWNNLHDLVKTRYSFQAHAAIDKLNTFYRQSLLLNGIRKTASPDNLIWRVELPELTEKVAELRCNSGYFMEYTAAGLTEISQFAAQHNSTIASYGIPQDDFLQAGINSPVPIGRTSDFSLTWNGYNLIESLTQSVHS